MANKAPSWMSNSVIKPLEYTPYTKNLKILHKLKKRLN